MDNRTLHAWYSRKAFEQRMKAEACEHCLNESGWFDCEMIIQCGYCNPERLPRQTTTCDYLIGVEYELCDRPQRVFATHTSNESRSISLFDDMIYLGEVIIKTAKDVRKKQTNSLNMFDTKTGQAKEIYAGSVR